MEAGYGAEEQATRRSRKLERLRRERSADESTRSAVENELERVQKQQRAWSAGAEGERQVASTLATLAPYGWTALHDVHWPGRPQANLDHVAIGPGGVVIIDAKNWTGEVALADGVLRQNGYRRDRELEGVAEACSAVTVLLAPQHRTKVQAALCLVGQDQAPRPAGPGVTVVGRLQLCSWLVGLPAQLSPYDVADLGRHLNRMLAGPQTPTLPPQAALARALGGGQGAPPPPVQPRARARRPRPRAQARATPVRRNAQARRPVARSRRRPSAGAELARFAVLIVGVLIFLQWVKAFTG